MVLYLMRHGPAEDRAPSGRDRDRALSRDGRGVVQAVAEELVRSRQSAISRLISSPALRAQETGGIVATIAGTKGLTVETCEELEPEADPAFDLMIELSRTSNDVLIVGHQPSIELLARAVLEASESIPSFCTALVVGVAIELGSARGRAIAIIDPRRLTVR